MIVPVIFVTVLLLKPGGPNDIPLGRYIRDTGLATPFVVLFFMSIWAFPLLTALVAGDIVATESQNGTLKTILTRSRDRGEIYAGKVLASFTYTASISAGDGNGRLAGRELCLGLLPRDLALGHDGQLRARARSARREPRGLPPADDRDRGLRDPALDGDAGTVQRRSSARSCGRSSCSCSASCPGPR